PGATVPFGAVQLSPETDTLSYEVDGAYNKDVYRYCAGYQYEDNSIVGFSHTHFSGTGHSDLGDLLVMPTVGTLKLNPGTSEDTQAGYRSTYSHDEEVAEANYYKVKLHDYDITAELTTSERVGFHRYTFPKTADAHLVFDLKAGIYNYDGKNVWTFVRVVNDTDRKSTRLNSSHVKISYAVFCLKKKTPSPTPPPKRGGERGLGPGGANLAPVGADPGAGEKGRIAPVRRRARPPLLGGVQEGRRL